MEEPTFDLRAYEPPASLWGLIEQHVPEHELEEIKNMLGASLIDQSLELRQEVDTLLDIWQDYREETTDNTKAKLPEPPGVRDRLVQEIQFFVDIIRERAKASGINPEKAVQLRHNPEIIEYALDTSRPASRCLSRPGTSHSRDGRETPMMCTPTGSDRMSAASTLSEEIESMNDKLNFLKFDEVVQSLRSTLEDEVETLLKDIRFLYECLDDEATYRAEVQGTLTREPTIAELQQERTKMEKELMNQIPSTAPPTKPAFNTGRNLPAVSVDKSSKQHDNDVSNVKTTKPYSANKSACPASRQGSSRPGPMRGSHAILNSNEENNSKYEYMFSVKDKSDQKISAKTLDKNINEKNHVTSVTKLRGRAISPSRARLVRVDMDSGQVSQVKEISNQENLVPSPPSSAKPSLPPRPSSAQRFRKMVMECRESN